MRVLRLEHDDFVLSVECNADSFRKAFQLARKKQGLFETAKYSFPGECQLAHPDHATPQPLTGETAHPVFFENRDYIFDVEFTGDEAVKKAYVFSAVKAVSEKFHFRKKLQLLSGTLNFGNNLGRFDLVIRYEKENEWKETVLSIEVFPVKLDYRTDYLQLIADIEEEYPLLVLSFLEKTYSSFRKGDSGEEDDLIWWQIFGGLYEDFSDAVRYILNKPHSRLVKETHFVRAEKLRRLSPLQEEELTRYHKDQPGRLYRTHRHTLTTDTPENRFLKYALTHVSHRFTRLREMIEDKYSKKISKDFKLHLQQMDKQLMAYRHHPFFRSVGEFKGIRQESLVLQKATGYSAIYKCWTMLRAGISFYEGIQKLELRNIAALYEIWCFLEMKRLVQNLLGGKKPTEVELARIQVDNFMFEFRSGERSKVSFVADNGDKIDLYHEFHFKNEENDELRSYTVEQEPDITLQVTKNDLRDNYVLTYLYDAKYRLQSDEQEGKPDLPPPDAINQMHRYRDAIYYSNKSNGFPEKEILGGYVLFPGAFDPEKIESAPFYRSIESVNIGAFPLRPNDSAGRVLLEKHLRGVIGGSSDEILKQVLPHKGNKYESTNPEVLIGVVKKGDQTRYFNEGGKFLLYHTGAFTRDEYEQFLEKNPNLRYFAPYIGGKGVREYYEIRSVSLRRRVDIFDRDHYLWRGDETERIVLSLGSQKFISESKDFYKYSVSLYAFDTIENLRRKGKGKQPTMTS